jgi:hypothetical protein
MKGHDLSKNQNVSLLLHFAFALKSGMISKVNPHMRNPTDKYKNTLSICVPAKGIIK